MNAKINGDYIVVSEITQNLMAELRHGCFSVWIPDKKILCNNRTSLWLLVKILIQNGYELN